MRRTISSLIAIVSVAALLTACGGGDDDTTATTASTTTASVATATSASGAGDAPTATGTAPAEEPTETTAVEETPTESAGDTDAEARLFDLLLSEDEFGEGWIETKRSVVEGEGSVGICGAQPFPRRDEKIAHVEANWEGNNGNTLALENIVEFPEDVVGEAMDYVHESLSCSKWTDEDGDTATAVPWDDPSLADLGDDHEALIVTIDNAGQPLDLYMIFVQNGTLITQVVYGDAVTTDPAEVEAAAVELVQMAIEKVEAGQ